MAKKRMVNKGIDMQKIIAMVMDKLDAIDVNLDRLARGLEQ